MPPMPKRRKLSSKFTDTTTPEEEIKFDNEARHEFLTGFHKRKLQRAKHAQEAAERRLKEEKREQKKRLREERQAELRRAFEEHQARMKEINGAASGTDDEDEDTKDHPDGGEDENDEWNGIAEPEPVDHTAEYIDEDKYTTVTVEEIDPTQADAFGSSSDSEEEEKEEDDDETGEEGDDEKKRKKKSRDENNDQTAESSADMKNNDKKKKKRIWSNDGSAAATTDKPKKLKKRRNFKYETKEERRVTRYKERTGNRKKAKERKRK